MEKSPETKKHYWGIVQNGTPLFEGSFNQCWKALVERYGSSTVSELEAQGINIARIG